jgi:hypothetical protein
METELQSEQNVYISPTVEIVQLNSEAAILIGSNEGLGGGGI